MRSVSRRLIAGVAIVVGALAPIVAVTPASAAAPHHVITAAGSDTTEAVMRAVLANFNKSAANTNHDGTANIPAVPGTRGYKVAADANCAVRTYAVVGSPPAMYTAPNGSGAGKTALADPTNLANGCIDVARSSAGPAAGESSAFRYFGYAKDAVSWAAFQSNTHAPATLTKGDIKNIYGCNVTDWAQVGGTSGPIQRYLPQAGSGTLKFFITNILDNNDPSTIAGVGCPAVKRVEENKGDQIDAADRTTAILPYSAGQWIAQANRVITDHRAGATVRSITVNNVAQNPVGPKVHGKYTPNARVINGPFPGARVVYNVLDTDSVDYAWALKAVGFDSANVATGVKSPLCTGKLATVLKTYGFLPLAADSHGITCQVETP